MSFFKPNCRENCTKRGVAIRSKVNGEIECLRAVAILMVLFDHLPALFNWGDRVWPLYGADPDIMKFMRHFAPWTGVDLFFAISGYVISLSFVESFDEAKRQGKQWSAIKGFWVRRFFRIAPSAWFWLLVTIVGSIIFNNSGQFPPAWDNLNSILPIVLSVGNFFSLNYPHVPIGIYWSLALEEQFYLVFPLVLALVVPRKRWIAFLIPLFILVFPPRPNLDSLIWHLRIDAMLWGCLVFQFSRTLAYQQFEPKFLQNKWAGLAASGILIALLLLISVHLPLKSRFVSQIAAVSGILVFLASYQKGYVLPLPGILKSIMVWIGSRSFAIYLIHIPVCHVTFELWFRIAGHDLNNTFIPVLSATALPLIVVLSELNYRLIETPLRRKGAAIARRMLGSAQPELKTAAEASP